MAQQNNRITLAITTYFASATASLAWILHRALPTRADRGWSEILHGATTLWGSAIPSELAVFVLLNFFVSALAMTAVITSALFLGRLSANESRRLSHRLVKYAVFKMVFVGSVITPDPRDIAVWFAWFAVVGYLRVFLGAAKDRLESLLSAPGAQLGRHARGVCLLLLVLVHNAASFVTVLRLLPRQSASRLLLCAFDSAVVAIEGSKTLLRYAVHMADRYLCLRAVAPPADVPAADGGTAAGGGGGGGWDMGGGVWASKGAFLYHVELVADVLVHAVTLAHYMHVWVLHGLSFHLIDAVLFMDMRAVLLSLLRRLRTHLTYRAATHRINNTFPDVHPAALAGCGGGGSADCTICMDEILHVAKQLPCGHVFHLSCLRAWLQQSGSETFTCPNCRKPILVGGGGGQEVGEEGGRRRESAWWLIRALDRAYVRLVVAIEPLLLTLLLRLTLWLGGREQHRRRVSRTQPSQPREGFGESPAPLASAADSHRSDDDEEDTAGQDEDQEEGDVVDPYCSDDPGRCRYSGQGDEGRNGQDADSDAEDADMAAVGVAAGGDRPDADGDYAAEVAEGTVRGCSGEYAGVMTRSQRRCRLREQEAAGGRRLETAPCAGAGGHRCTFHGLGPLLSGPAQQQGPRQGSGRLSSRCCDGAPEQMIAAGGAGPSCGVPAGRAAARGRARRGLPAPSAEVPSFSGDVLACQAAAAARQLGRTVSTSIRSSWAMGGVCAGAVAGGDRSGDDSDHEVSSRRRHTRKHRDNLAPRQDDGRAAPAQGDPRSSN